MATRTVGRTRAPAAPRPVPERSSAFEHLTLDALRAYRKALTAEEGRVSYWRRLIQARMDVVAGLSSGSGADPNAHERLREMLAQSRTSTRHAVVEMVSGDDIPPLPDLADLWARQVHPYDQRETERLQRDLGHAELQLSAYRLALHRKLAQATGELIARYRENPSLALTALPIRSPGSQS